MAYSDFTLSEIKEQFQIALEAETNLFAETPAVAISDFLREILAENIPLALAIHTEKARSEMIITPILIELRKQLKHQIGLFSGVEFSVDREKGLNGTCDYLISRSKEQLYVSSPVVTIVEAKNDNLKSGLAQCAAAMIAAQIFNQQKGNPIDPLHGIVTSGSNWRFLQLSDKTLWIDLKEYYIEQIDQIFGILYQIANPNP